MGCRWPDVLTATVKEHAASPAKVVPFDRDAFDGVLGYAIACCEQDLCRAERMSVSTESISKSILLVILSRPPPPTRTDRAKRGSKTHSGSDRLRQNWPRRQFGLIPAIPTMVCQLFAPTLYNQKVRRVIFVRTTEPFSGHKAG